MTPLAVTIFAAGLIACIVILIIPVLCYYLHIYYIHRANPIIRKRHYKIMIVFNVLLMISLIGDKSLYMLAIIVTDTLKEAESHFIYEISDYVYFCVGPALVLSMGLMAWMVYYDLTWVQVANPHNNWTHFVDPKYNNNQSDLFANNWFIKNRATFGNTQWLNKCIMLPLCAIVYLTLFLSLFISHNIHYIFFMSWMALISLFIAVVICNIPKENLESLKIKSQIDLMIRIEVMFVICFALYVTLRLLVPESYQFAVILPFQYIFAFQYFLGGIVSTRYVFIECDLLNESKKEAITIKHMKYAITNSIELSNNQQNDTTISKNKTKMTLADILKEKVSFHVFMAHLLREFSSENLLAILECFQFKMMIKDINDQSGNCNALLYDKRLAKYAIPPEKDGMPQSAIVYNHELAITDKVVHLIEKYVFLYQGNCPFEVNISSRCRLNIIQQSKQLQQLTKQALYDIFDEMILELIKLLYDSHTRFIRSENYKQLKKIHLSK